MSQVLALSPAVEFRDINAPTGVRLARTPSTDEMRVSWTASPATVHDAAVVQWGLSQESLNRSTPAQTATTYTAGLLLFCWSDAQLSFCVLVPVGSCLRQS